ncbi:response regulator transcription factor [Bifidobacterium merycicum]|uniref:response regulator transcription factor n=1 Tax=Bifidobacterium merycicum TaxID=78345 RepID=UPI00156A63E4|nr:response regulator transcription factor [Bifidobacterium merycicum]
MPNGRRNVPKRIALVDNDELALRVLDSLVSDHLPGLYVAWQSTSGLEAVSECSGQNGHYDLLMLDMSMEDMQGASVCRRIRCKNRYLQILGMTSFFLNRYRNAMIEAGAQGLIGKEDLNRMAGAMAHALNGVVMEGFETPQGAYYRIRNSAEGARLTPTEETVIELASNVGLRDDEIAERLHVAPATVRKHMQNLTRKLGCRTSRQAVSLWLRNHEHDGQ